MTEKEMWRAFTARNPQASEAEYDAWCYGSEAADTLAELTRDGVKTATASAYPLYELEGEPLPAEGEYNVILRRDGRAVCVTRTTRISLCPFHEVSPLHAWLEGEGDRSLRYWREVHEAFFTEELAQAGLKFTQDLMVVCEEFEVVFKEASAESVAR